MSLELYNLRKERKKSGAPISERERELRRIRNRQQRIKRREFDSSPEGQLFKRLESPDCGWEEQGRILAELEKMNLAR